MQTNARRNSGAWRINFHHHYGFESGFDIFSTYIQWHPTPVLLPGKSHGRRGLVGCSPWGRLESDMTERLHFPFSLSCIGEGNGNPLQCSCLENPRDGGAWWGLTESDTTEATQQQQQLLISYPVFLFTPLISSSDLIMLSFPQLFHFKRFSVKMLFSMSLLQCLENYGDFSIMKQQPK